MAEYVNMASKNGSCDPLRLVCALSDAVDCDARFLLRRWAEKKFASNCGKTNQLLAVDGGSK